MEEFQGKVVLITGGSSGVGLATAAAFAREGASLLITGRDQERLDAAKASISGRVETFAVNVESVTEISQFCQRLLDQKRSIDVLFANAGIAEFQPIAETSVEMYDRIMNINTRGAFFTVQQAAPLMREGGSIVLNTSFLAEVGVPGSSALSASKAAVRSFVRTFASELWARRIRVNSVSPGAIETPLWSKLGLPPDVLQRAAARTQAAIPMGRFGSASEVAQCVLFLASSASSYLTGCDLPVDGGRTQI